MSKAVSKLDEKLSPLLAMASKEAEQQASRKAELEALKALNEARKKQGKEPYPEDDKEDKDMPKRMLPANTTRKTPSILN